MSDNKKKTSRTLSLRMSDAEATQIELAARLQGVTTSAYICDILKKRVRQNFPAVCALGEILSLIHALRADPTHTELVQQLKAEVRNLHRAVEAELDRPQP